MSVDRNGIAVVTGAGSGLGRALVIELQSRGLRVAGISLNAADLAETGRLCADPRRFHGFACDVSDYAAVKSTFDEIRMIAPVSLLINNAAVYPHRDFLDETPESFMQTVAVNLGGTVACTHFALQDMVSTGAGRILNVASFGEGDPPASSGAYLVSKGATKLFTKSLVKDICDRFPHIVINDWVPGHLATPMGDTDGIDPAIAARWGCDLALLDDPTLSGTLWNMAIEILGPRSLKRRLLDKLLLLPQPEPRRLSD